MDVPATTQRVTQNTRPDVNARIREQTEARIAYFARHPDEIAARLVELDREWDIERAIEANAASLSLIGLGLGLFVNRKFLVVPAVVGGFLLQHSIQGWCPPVPLFRRMGFRTQSEIEAERYALKALRGDFEGVGDPDDPGRAPRAFRAIRA